MTLPDERLKSLRQTKEFLYRLLDPKMTPKVPSEIRKEAGYLLKHYPENFCLDDLPKEFPKMFE